MSFYGRVSRSDHLDNVHILISRYSVVSVSSGSLLAGPFLLPDSPSEPDLLARYFKVLSDATRVRILELLASAEMSVSELMTELGQSQSRVSNHLACLRWCGFVETRRAHRAVYYRVADHRVLEVLALGRALLAENADHVAACRRVDGGGSVLTAAADTPRSGPDSTLAD